LASQQYTLDHYFKPVFTHFVSIKSMTSSFSTDALIGLDHNNFKTSGDVGR